MTKLLRLLVGVLTLLVLMAVSAPTAPSASPPSSSGSGGSAPTASFTASTSEGIAPLSVTFSNMSKGVGNPTPSFLWSFGDGSKPVGDSSPSHTFSKAGTFTVTLKASNVYGFTTSSTTITVTPPLPTTSFSVSASSGAWPLKVTFKNKTKGASSYTWDFNDGTTSTATSPTHTFTRVGTFVVGLAAKNVSGSLSVTQTITVINPLPKANFSASATSGLAPLAVAFGDKSTAAASYAWDFGDGASSTSASPTHSFVAPGKYKVVETVTNDRGSSNKSVTITVKARQPDLKLSLSEDDWVPGQNIAYLQVSVSNIGNAASTGAVVTLTLPAKKTFLEAQVDSGSDDGVCTVTGNTATCPLDVLAPGAEPAVVEFAATLSVGSKVSASVKGNETEPSTKNNSAGATIKKLAW